MNKFLPLIFVLLWSSAFVTTKPIATIRNLKANAENGSLLSTIGLVVTKADDHKKINAKDKLFFI